jgi:hypothetical protein
MLSGIFTMLTGFARAVAGGLGRSNPAAGLAINPSGFTVLAATVLAGAALAAMLVLVASVARMSRVAAALPLLRRASALRERSWRAGFTRQRDPDAAGRPRPRAPCFLGGEDHAPQTPSLPVVSRRYGSTRPGGPFGTSAAECREAR